MISELVSKTSLAQSRAAGSLRDVKEAALKNLTHQINALFYLLTLSSFLTSSWERTSARCFRKKKKILEEANWSRDSFFKTDPLEFQFQICLIQLGLNSTVCRLHARFFFFCPFQVGHRSGPLKHRQHPENFKSTTPTNAESEVWIQIWVIHFLLYTSFILRDVKEISGYKDYDYFVCWGKI